MHHDNGLLGACAIDRAEERRVELMKARGFNAIRTAHIPPSTAFLDACDRLGMLVMDQAFDPWERQKNAQDYHLYFNERKRTDLSFVTLEVLDQNDQPVPDAVVPVSFSISGVGELAAAGTANPQDVESFRQTRLRTYHGRALAIVRPMGIAGSVTLRVQASGFAPASAVVQVT